MKRALQILFCCSLVLPAVAAAAQPETLSLTLGLDWSSVSTREQRGHVTIEYLRHGDDIDHPKERFAYQNGILRSKNTPEQEFERIKADTEKDCPGATEWNVIAQDESSILYESQSKRCRGEPDSHVITRIIHGKHNFFALIYVSMGDSLEPATRTKWIGILQDASVETEAPGERIAPLDVDETIPFPMDKVMAAVKPAMESVSCSVKESSAERVECKRPRVVTDRQNDDVGGESVTAVLEAQGNQTRIRITTGKGFYGRLGKQSWSITIFQEMMKRLLQAQP
jgi:hypothetical protein